jgi:hypothetical protein
VSPAPSSISTCSLATHVGDELYEEIFHPIAHRLLALCDGVLRLPGASTGADNDVKIAMERGVPVWYDLNDVPGVAA